MIKVVIFDIDGVLVDSREARVALLQALLNKGGYPPSSREDILKCSHLPLWQTLEKLTSSTNQTEIKRLWELAHNPAVRAERGGNLFVFPDALESTLEELHQQYTLAIVTSRIKIGIEEIFNIKEIKHFFATVVSFEDYTHPKPHPEPLQITLQRLGSSANAAVYVGDSDTDIEAAVAAGMQSIHLAPKKHPQATLGITDFGELTAALRQLS